MRCIEQLHSTQQERHDDGSQHVSMKLLRLWRLPRVMAAGLCCMAGGLLRAEAAPLIPFPSPDSLRQVQLAALACARENSSESCNRAKQLGDPLLDHPRLTANCKDLIWEMLAKAQPATSNSFSRRQAISDPAERLLLVCRSNEKPETAEPPAAQPSSGGINFGGGQR